MSIVEIRGGRITHQYLMRKSKSELAYMVLDYLKEIERLRQPEGCHDCGCNPCECERYGSREEQSEK